MPQSLQLIHGISMFSVVIPVYLNEEFIPQLLTELEAVADTVSRTFKMPMEVVFVVDGSPDRSHALLMDLLPKARFSSQLLLHSRNFGSFAAIRSGLIAAKGANFAVIAADLQESPQILLAFLQELSTSACDVVVGTRTHRNDPFVSRMFSSIFWASYRRWVIRDIPKGGVDIFGCNKIFRDELIKLGEANSSLVGQVYWLGFRRKEIGYVRHKRMYGRSAWSMRKRITYLLDSVFAFTDLPIRLLTIFGAIGTIFAVVIGTMVVVLRLLGMIVVPGYAPTVLTISFFGALNMLGIGLIGSYAWRAFENTKGRPLSIVRNLVAFDGAAAGGPQKNG
jgi:glycosyltransferase involved in cell wall biosynthesis